MVSKTQKCLGCGFKLKTGWTYCPNCALVAPKQGKQLALYIEVKLRQGKFSCWNCGKRFNRSKAGEDYKKLEVFYCTKCGARQDIPIATVWLLQEKGKDLPENELALLSRKAGE